MLRLREERGYIRSVDVAELLGVTKPSVSGAAKRLRENGYIVMESGGQIALSDAGAEIAQRMWERHRLIAEMLIALGVTRRTALADACRLEHDLSEESFEAIRAHVDTFGGGKAAL